MAIISVYNNKGGEGKSTCSQTRPFHDLATGDRRKELGPVRNRRDGPRRVAYV